MAFWFASEIIPGIGDAGQPAGGHELLDPTETGTARELEVLPKSSKRQ
jgi:hypothetical protein